MRIKKRYQLILAQKGARNYICEKQSPNPPPPTICLSVRMVLFFYTMVGTPVLLLEFLQRLTLSIPPDKDIQHVHDSLF